MARARSIYKFRIGPRRPLAYCKTAAEILKNIAHENGVKVSHLKGENRKPRICKIRHHCYWAIMFHLGRSARWTARFMNRSDHSTVCHGVKKHCERTGEKLPPRLGRWVLSSEFHQRRSRIHRVRKHVALMMFRSGKTGAEVADRLDITEGAVSTYRTALRKEGKLHA